MLPFIFGYDYPTMIEHHQLCLCLFGELIRQTDKPLPRTRGGSAMDWSLDSWRMDLNWERGRTGEEGDDEACGRAQAQCERRLAFFLSGERRLAGPPKRRVEPEEPREVLCALA